MGKDKKDSCYWNEQLRSLKDHEKFIWDYCDESSYKQGLYREVIDKEFGNKLSDICKNNSILMYTFLVSTLKITLSKYMGKNDIVIGIPCYSNQNSRGNVHINKLLPLVSYIDHEMTYLEYMSSIKAKVLENYKNQAYLSPKILVQNGLPNDVMELTPISICMKGIHEDKDINYICESSKNELSFLLDPIEDKSIDIQIVYNSNKITDVTVKALYESYITALRDILSNYNKNIKDIKILSEKDMEKILCEFNNTEVDYSKDKTIHELFEAQVEKTPNNIAVVFEDKKLTYRELNEKSNSLARVLRDKGVKSDSIVVIMLERSLEMIVGIMGILKAGGAYLPIDPNYPKERIEYMLKDSNSQVLLSKNDLVENIEFNGAFIDLYNEELFNKDCSNLDKINNSTNLAYVIYTSGTTGKPKGAMIEHKSLVNRLNWMQKKYPISEKDTILQKTTYTFDVSVWEILWWSLVGAKVCMLSHNAEKDPMKIMETIDKYEITTMHFVPSMLEVFLYCVEENRNNINLSSLRQVFSSGEALNFKQVSKFYKEFDSGKKLINLYGPTEATIDVSYFDCANDGRKIIPIGKPIDNTKLYILKNTKLVPIGAKGELYIAGDGLSRGYLNRPELTAEKFVDNPFKIGTKMYRTGDLAKWLPDGNIEFLGRIDNQIKIRGFRIELGEIENRLLQHESVKEAAVLVKENNDSDKYMCAYVVSEKNIQELDLKGYLKETLPEYMVPAYFVELEKMPLTTNGKLDRRAFPEPNLDATLNEYEAPRNEVEETLAKIWSEVLGVEKIGINDNFFDLGGHSLKATIVISKIHKELNKDVQLTELFKLATIKELGKYIESLEEHIYSKIEKVEEKEYYETSSSQKRMYILQEFDRDSTAYNMPAVFELEGKIDKNKIEEAFRKLTQRHEALITYFETYNGEIVQKLKYNYDFKLSYRKDDKDINEIINKFIKPFYLEEAPLFRVELIENFNKTYLLIDMHHIISDGTTINIMMNDFIALYDGIILDELELQYKDFAAWQNNLMKSSKIKKQKEYWINMFKDDIPTLSLPYDYERPSIQSFEGKTISFDIGEHIVSRLNVIAKETNSTIYMILLSAVNILLSKYAGQEDIVIGSPIAGRKEFENIAGMFVNTLPMRNYPNGDKKYEEFLIEVRDNCLKSYENQDYQFEELVDELKLERDAGKNPLFDVMLILQNMKKYNYESSSLFAKQYIYDTNTSKFDLLFIASEVEKNIQFELQYCSKIFNENTIKSMIERFKSILFTISGNRNIKLSEIDILFSDERDKLLNSFNDTYREYCNDKTIQTLFEEQVERTPNDIALIFRDKEITYEKLNYEANKLASFLIYRCGIRRNDRVGIFMERSEYMIISMLGILKSGAAYVPIDPNYPVKRIKTIIDDCEINTVLTSKEQINTVNKLHWQCKEFKNYICIDSDYIYDLEETLQNELMNEELWDYVVESSSNDIGEGGWKSSYTGEEFSKEEMKEYSTNTLKKLKPYLNNEISVLEIGCASGLTMFEVAPYVKKYYGIDMSSATIERNKDRVKKNCIENIKLECLPAHRVSEIEDKEFDIIIINSVIQYFPGINYLHNVIKDSINLLRSKGIIYVGDIMDADLKSELINSLDKFKNEHEEYRNRTKSEFDSELFLPREYFEDLSYEVNDIKGVEFSNKIFTIKNELTKFRYDCILEVDKLKNAKCADLSKKNKHRYTMNDLKTFDKTLKVNNSDSNDLAYVIYTSGSTGNPKGVEIEHKSVINFINGITEQVDLTNKNAILAITNLTFDIFVLESLLPLCIGLKIVLADEEAQIDPKLIDKLINDWNIDILQLTPSRMNMLINNYSKLESFKNVKDILIGGEALKENMLNELTKVTNANIYNVYGPTETTVWSTICKLNSGDKITVGKPISNTQIYILDKNMKISPIGVIGELYIAGDGLARGYLNSPEATATKFVENIFKPGTRMYRTGDIARWLNDGNIEIMGRIDNQVKVRGFRIELGEIENKLLQHKEVNQVAVVVKENKNFEKFICAYIVSKKDIKELGLKNYLSKSLPQYMIPSYFVQLENMPLNFSGKLDIKMLPSPTDHINTGVEYMPPRNEIDEQILKVWSEVLDLNIIKIGIKDDFFSLGGNSILVVKTNNLLKNYFNYNIPLNEFYKKPTIEACSDYLSLIDQSINVKLVNKQLQETFGIDKKLINYNADNGNVLILHANDKKDEIMTYLKGKYNGNFLPQYILEYDDNIESLSETIDISLSQLSNKLKLIDYSEEKFNECINIINENNRYIEKSINIQENVRIHKLGKVINDKNKEYEIKKSRRVMMVVVEINSSYSESFILNSIKNLINDQPVLRMSLLKNNNEYFYAEHKEIENLKLKVLDLSQLSFESKNELAGRLINYLHQNIALGDFLNKLLYSITLIKSDLKKYYLTFYLDHQISDSETMRIIRSYFTMNEKDHTLNAPEYIKYINTIFKDENEEEVKTFTSSNYFIEFKNSAESFYDKYPKYIGGKAIIFTRPLIIKYNYNFNKHNDENPLQMSLFIALKVIESLFSIKSIPLRIFYNDRNIYNEYYYTIGDFTDSIFSTFKIDDLSYDTCGDIYYSTINFFIKNKIILKSFKTNKELSDLIYTKAPFNLNYIGSVSKDDDRKLMGSLANFKNYSILAYDSSSYLRVAFQNGIEKDKIESIMDMLNDLRKQYPNVFMGSFEYMYL